MWWFAPAFAQDPDARGALRACVLDVDELPIPGVELTLHGEAGVDLVDHTDETGCADVSLAAGTWRAVVVKAGFQGATLEDVQVQPGRTTVQNVTLEEEGYI